MDVEETLGLWDGFPVGGGARPIVLMDAAIGPGRLPRVEDRERVMGGRPVVSEVELPVGVLERLQPERAPRGDPEPVRVVGVRQVYPEFRTDRGHRPLPAWRVEFAVAQRRTRVGGGYSALLVLDDWAEERLWWPAGLSRRWLGGEPGMSAAVLTDRGRTVRMVVGGALPGCTEVLVWAVHESRTAVLVEIEEVDLHPGAPMPLALVGRPVAFRLQEALGARVLLRANGLPVEVVSAG